MVRLFSCSLQVVILLTSIFMAVSQCNFLMQMMSAMSKTLNSPPRLEPSALSSDLAAEEEELQNSVMLEVGLELLLKEPVFSKVRSNR